MESRSKDTKTMNNSLHGNLDHHLFSEAETAEIRQKLLKWYQEVKRDLPWRTQVTENKDPNRRAYAVWVSEIMLQQTQVATVVDYYNKWMKRWPTVDKLAEATIEEVNEMWSGLGYYSRGRRLQEGAVKVMKELNGKIPQNANLLLKYIPGVGRYTAGAIASIAFNEATGLVDGNVIRVFSRLRAIGADSTLQSTVNLLWKLANKTVDPEKPGDFNQSLMELGATVCTPRNAQCRSCPVSDHCKAFKRSLQTVKRSLNTLDKFSTKSKTESTEINVKSVYDIEDCMFCLPPNEPWDDKYGVENYPRKPKKRPAREEDYVVGIYRCTQADNSKEHYLLKQRSETGLLAGLWEFPSTIMENQSQERKAIHLLDLQNASIFGNRNTNSKPLLLGKVAHIFSHLHHTYHVGLIEVQESDMRSSQFNESDQLKWVTNEELNKSAVSAAVKKIFSLYEKHLSGEKVNSRDQPLGKRKREETIPNQARLDKFFKPSA